MTTATTPVTEEQAFAEIREHLERVDELLDLIAARKLSGESEHVGQDLSKVRVVIVRNDNAPHALRFVTVDMREGDDVAVEVDQRTADRHPAWSRKCVACEVAESLGSNLERPVADTNVPLGSDCNSVAKCCAHCSLHLSVGGTSESSGAAGSSVPAAPAGGDPR